VLSRSVIADMPMATQLDTTPHAKSEPRWFRANGTTNTTQPDIELDMQTAHWLAARKDKGIVILIRPRAFRWHGWKRFMAVNFELSVERIASINLAG